MKIYILGVLAMVMVFIFKANAQCYPGIIRGAERSAYDVSLYNEGAKRSGPAVQIFASVDSVCAVSAPVTFTAQTYNIADSAAFQWQKNGANVGTDSAMYYDPAIVQGDSVSCKVFLTAGGLLIVEAGRKMAIDSVAPAIPIISVSGIPLLCTGISVTLAATATGGTWSGGGAAVATVTSNVVTGVTAGNDIVTYSRSNSCGSSSDTILLHVLQSPQLDTISGAPSLCTSATISLMGGGPGVSWSSSSSGATVSSSGSVTGIFPGIAVITASIANSCGALSDTMWVNVVGQPLVDPITGVRTLCTGATVTLANAVAGGVWTTPGPATATVSNGVVTGVSAGLAPVIYTVSNMCGTASDTIDITVSAQPTAGTITGADTVCDGSVTSLSNSEPGGWWNSSVPNVGTITYGGVFSALTPGTTQINYLVANSCGFAVAAHSIIVRSDEDCGNGPAWSVFNISPNPTTGSMMIALPKADPDAVISIMEVSGRIVKELRPGNNALQIPVSISELARGTYLIKVKAAGTNYIQKIVLW